MDTSKILAELHGERKRINQAIAVLETLNGSAVSTRTAPKTPKSASPATQALAKKRVVSQEARQRMAEAQQKRWAKKKRAAKAAGKIAEKAATATA